MTTATGPAVPPVAIVDPENRGVGAVHNAASPPHVAASGPGAAAPSEPRPASGAVSSEPRSTSGATPTSVPVPTATSPAASSSQPRRKAPRILVRRRPGDCVQIDWYWGSYVGFRCLEDAQEETDVARRVDGSRQYYAKDDCQVYYLRFSLLAVLHP